MMSRSIAQSSLPRSKRSAAPLVVACMILFSIGVTIAAQQPRDLGDKKEPAAGSDGSKLQNLAVAQAQVADRYARLEQLLIRMAELEATSNPQRSALLKRAAQQSADRLTRQQLETLIKLLAPPSQLKRAIDEQQQVVNDLRALLELLQSENRSDRLKSEQSRVREYIKDVERLIRLQKGVQGRTEGGDDAGKLAGDQTQIADRTGELAQRIRENEEGQRSGDDSKEGGDQQGTADDKSKSGKPGSNANSKDGSKSSSGKEGDKQGQEKNGQGSDEQKDKPTADKASDDQGKKTSDSKSRDSQQSDSKHDAAGKDPQDKNGSSKGSKENSGSKASGKESKKGSSQKGKGSPGESQPGDPSSESSEDQQPMDENSQENPARKRLEAAQERMREAQRKLAEANRKDATQQQQEAREELERAKAELEQILRQLREEEVERTLALLEGRFRKMLDTQLRIYESTKRLDKIPANKRSRELDIEASKLSFDESKLAIDADKALLLLREEGSSVAFPETVELVRDDMTHVAERLSTAKVDRVTQGLEEEIIQSLEELIAALQKAQQELKDKQQQQQQKMQPGDPNSRPLVDKLAELRMIRSLQFRINGRTQRYARLLEDMNDPVGRANDADLRQSLLKLAEMEQRVFEITRNIVLGKNE